VLRIEIPTEGITGILEIADVAVDELIEIPVEAVGDTGEDCDDLDDWTILDGDLLVTGNNAVFGNGTDFGD
jgi:hypothetical protein